MRDVGSSVLDFWEAILQLSTMCVQVWMFVGMSMQAGLVGLSCKNGRGSDPEGLEFIKDGL